MRSQYTEAELANLDEMAKLLAAEIRRMSQIIISAHRHLVTCESPDHRAEIVHRASNAVAGVLNTLRYCSWIEAEVTKDRVFGDPQAALDELVAQQTELAEAFKAKTETPPQPPTGVIAIPTVQEITLFTEREQTKDVNKSSALELAAEDVLAAQAFAMDEAATAPLVKTVQ